MSISLLLSGDVRLLMRFKLRRACAETGRLVDRGDVGAATTGAGDGVTGYRVAGGVKTD